MFNTFYHWGGLNLELFYRINSLRSPFIDQLALLGSWLGNLQHALILILLLFMLITLRQRYQQPRWLQLLPSPMELVALQRRLILACVLTALLVFSLKAAFDMPRPYLVLAATDVYLLQTPKDPYSFPSGHAALAMMLCCVFWPSCPRHLRILLLCYPLWIGLSRISVGVHFPSDVLAGYGCGAVCAGLAGRLTRRRR